MEADGAFISVHTIRAHADDWTAEAEGAHTGRSLVTSVTVSPGLCQSLRVVTTSVASRKFLDD